jgi:trk system potassium uptake protein
MYFKEVLKFLGSYLSFLGVVLLVPFFTSIYFQFYVPVWRHPQPHSTLAFFLTIVITFALAFFFKFKGKRKKDVDRKIYRKEGLILVALIWFFTAFVGALPFYLSGTLSNPVDAYFESMSGLTTTGASVMTAKSYDPETKEEIPIVKTSAVAPHLKYQFYGTITPVVDSKNRGVLIEGVEAVGKGLLLWRSLMQWLGGMGIVVLFVAVLPALGVGGKVLYSAEVPGPNKGGMTPRIKETASKLWRLYLSMTLIQILLLYSTNTNVGWFDALVISFSSISTGGFSVKNESIAAYSSYHTELIVLIFMILGSINFNVYFNLLKRKFARAFSAELKVYMLSLLIGSAVIAFYIYGEKNTFLNGEQEVLGGFDSFRLGFFQLVSAQSSTGFVTTNYDTWPYACQVLMLIAMFFGGMSGSTGGGVKVIRFMMIFRIIQNKVEKIYRPETTKEVVLEGRVIDEKAGLTVLIYLVIVVAFSLLGTLLYTFDKVDPETALSLSACMINNIGISFRSAGPTESFAFLSNFSKIVSIFWMLLGRLEFFALLVLLTPSFWKSR